MKWLNALILSIPIILTSSIALAQTESNIEVTKLTDKIYEIVSNYQFSTNMVASVGEDGILLVDAGPKQTGEELKRVLKTLGNGQAKIIINTHAHVEHTGGNMAFGKNVLKIGYENLRERLQNGMYILEEYPEEALPTITFADSLSLYFNGERIRLIALPGAHDNGDIIVHFTKSKVVSMGALCNGMHFPTLDQKGGNAFKYPEMVQKAIDLLPADVTLVPGHGRTCTIAEEKEFQNMLASTTEIVRTGLASGKDVATLQKEKVLKDWANFEGGFATADDWIQMIASSMQNNAFKKPVAAELYYILKENDGDSAVAKWIELKKSSPDQYNFGEGQLVATGHYLLGKNRNQDALKIFKLYVKEFPEAWNAYDCLGEAYMTIGEKKLARKNYEKSLKLNPGNTNAEEMLKKL